MAKKNFKNGINEIFGALNVDSDNKLTKVGSKTREEEKQTVRTTIITNKKHMDEIKSIAYWERKTITDVLNESILLYINKYKSENGEIKEKK